MVPEVLLLDASSLTLKDVQASWMNNQTGVVYPSPVLYSTSVNLPMKLDRTLLFSSLLTFHREREEKEISLALLNVSFGSEREDWHRSS